MAVKYLCDSCGKEIENFSYNLHKYILPRRVNYCAEHEGVKIMVYTKIERKDTLLCDNCIQILSASLEEI